MNPTYRCRYSTYLPHCAYLCVRVNGGSIQYVDEWRGISIRRRIALKCNPLLKAESPLQVTDSKTARPRMPPAPSCAPA